MIKSSTLDSKADREPTTNNHPPSDAQSPTLHVSRFTFHVAFPALTLHAPTNMEPHDWNFDSIPDHHLIACCYWEYARESIFLKKFKSRCVEANRNPQPLSQAFDLVGKDARTILSIGTVANSFLLGFGFDPKAAPNPATAGEAGSIPHSPLSTHHSQHVH